MPESWGSFVTTLIDYGYFPFVALLLLLVLTTLYHLALPNPLPWHRLVGGAVIAGIFSGTFIRINHHGRACAAAVAGWAVCIMAFGAVVLLASRGAGADTAWPLALACATLVAAGVMDSVSMLFRTTILQAATPDALRSRLQGIFIVVVTGGPRLGALYAGTLATFTALWFPPLLGGMLIIALVAVLVRLSPRFRAYDAEHPVP